MPPFNEQQVDFYFNAFEKMANIDCWPKDRWVALLEHMLIGTARKVYDSLSIEQSSDCDLVKDYILRVYESIPEFYR